MIVQDSSRVGPIGVCIAFDSDQRMWVVDFGGTRRYYFESQLVEVSADVTDRPIT